MNAKVKQRLATSRRPGSSVPAASSSAARCGTPKPSNAPPPGAAAASPLKAKTKPAAAPKLNLGHEGSRVDQRAGQPAPSQLERMYSMRSQETVDTLQEIESALLDIKRKTQQAEALMNDPPSEGLPPQLRNNLAQLHGDANRLLATRIDAILTGELCSGKEDARAKRKELIALTETLIDQIETQVKRFDQLKP
ncbi:hypothetical protein AB1Y20_005184 [Prymnesium parvum]|uniref:BAG domain-containing protein n=2 Tax=Prymnesium parvum TaxID=97485 RepID=A0AB34J3K2_PRYPA